MLEQVRGLRVDLERVLLIQQVEIEPFITHHVTVLQATTILPESWRSVTFARRTGCGISAPHRPKTA